MEQMSTLSAALKDVLEKRGILSEVRAKLRAEVYNALDDQTTLSKPKLCRENLLLNELIRDYCEYNRYKNTCSVLVTETGQPKENLDRDFLAGELNLVDYDESLPLLYQMLTYFLQKAPCMRPAHCHAGAPGSTTKTRITTSVHGHPATSGTCTIEEPTCIHTDILD